MSVTPARTAAFAVVRRVFEQGAYADRALHGEAASLVGRERGLAMTLAFGTVQRKRTLDYVIEALASRTVERIDPSALAALRLGLFQLLFLDGISDYAAVHESVELAKAQSKGAGGFVNAILRRAGREGRGLLEGLDDAHLEDAAILHSVPDWLARMWWDELGEDDARGLLRRINEPAESALRINTLRGDGAGLEIDWRPAEGLPEGRVLSGAFDVFASDAWREGLLMPQSRASMLVSRAVAPEPGERVLDACAAPGGKTTHLAALMGGEGEVVAVEAHPGRATALSGTCTRMGAVNVRVLNADARKLDPELGTFDRVLLDPPCSGLGTLQSRPDLRWQATPESIGELALRQRQLLSAVAARLRPGGTLVYSLCTVSRVEGDGVVDGFLAGNPEFTDDGRQQLLQHRELTDGFYIARLRRS
jgi:16S rRNA (cytosine967-C5)-methyltransferase